MRTANAFENFGAYQRAWQEIDAALDAAIEKANVAIVLLRAGRFRRKSAIANGFERQRVDAELREHARKDRWTAAVLEWEARELAR